VEEAHSTNSRLIEHAFCRKEKEREEEEEEEEEVE